MTQQSDANALAPDSFCSLTDPQPYQRERVKPRQGVMASTLKLLRNGAVGFIDWLDCLGYEVMMTSVS